MKVFYAIVLLSVLVACRSTRPNKTVVATRDTVQTKGGNDSMRLIDQVQQGLEKNRIPFQTFSSKVKVDYHGAEGKNYDVNANIRMVKDSAIWMSVNAVLGIEAMRVLITQDSVQLLDKLNKTYTARPISYLQELTALPLNLATLQDLLIGNPVFLDSNVARVTQADGAVSLLMLGKLFKNLITVTGADNALQHINLSDVDTARRRTADLSYDDYDKSNSAPFARKRIISVSDKKKLDINLDFKQYDFNQPISLPFSVPKNFTAR